MDDRSNDRLVPYADPAASAPPEPPTHHIERSALMDLLDLGAGRPVTVVSAPAGGGKTTLLASWLRLRHPRHPVIWLSCERTRGDVFALLLARMAAAGLVPVPEPDLAPGEVLRRIDAVATPVIVVLDDVPDRPDPAFLAGVEQLVESGHGRVNLVLSARSEPPLPLALWHKGGLLMRLQAAQLAFTRTDAAALLAAHGVTLSDSALLELYSLTEGWPVALRMTAQSLQGEPEPDRLVPQFALQDRGLGDYLVGEVLNKMHRADRELLLCMSVVDCVTPDLAARLSGRSDGAALLAALERSNLFVVRHIRNRQWYDLHPLLGMLLYDELRRRSPDLTTRTHRLASEWYEQNDMPADAIRHALAARWWARAAAMTRRQWPRVLPGRHVRTLKGAAAAPPRGALDDPWLVLAFAVERLDAGDLIATTTYLRLLDKTEHVVVGEELEQLHQAAAAVRISHAYQTAEPDIILETICETSAEAARDSEAVRAFALLSAGAAHLYQANLSAAQPVLADALRLARRLGLPHCRTAALSRLALVNAFSGELHAATYFAEEILADLHTGDQRYGNDAAWAELALAEVFYHKDNLVEANRCLDRVLGASTPDDLTPVSLVTFIRYRIRAATGDRYAAAMALATTRRQLYVGHIQPVLTQLLQLVESDLRLAAGQATSAGNLLDEVDPAPQLQPLAAISRAKLDLAGHRPAAAAAALLPELESAYAGAAWTVEASLLYAEALSAQGERSSAGEWLGRAVDVAAQEGIRRPFSARGATHELLSEWRPEKPHHRRLAAELTATLTLPEVPAGQDVPTPAEPLTERELTVLRYLQGMMSTAEISSALFVSINTVKTHVKSIYRKLGASRRREAVERAHQLHLL